MNDVCAAEPVDLDGRVGDWIARIGLAVDRDEDSRARPPDLEGIISGRPVDRQQFTAFERFEPRQTGSKRLAALAHRRPS